MSRRIRWALGAVAFVSLVLGVWAFWLEPASLVIDEDRVSLCGAIERPLRIAILSDLHVGSAFNRVGKLRRVVDRTNDARADIVCILGDLVISRVIGGTFVPPEDIATELRRLRAPGGIFAVLGNHDGWFDHDRVAMALDRAGIHVVEERAERTDTPGGPLWIAGVSDFWTGRPDVRAALATVNDTAPIILLTHNPDMFPLVPVRVSLTLAGHTHGGQVRLPFIGRPIVPSRFGERYAAGHIVERGKHMFVATGVGTSILPVRFRVPPAVSVLTLACDESAGR